MYIKEWLANQTHVATSVFHLGRYCDDWKASTYPTGMPSFHLVLEGQCWLRFTDRNTVVNLSEGDIVFFFFNMPFYLVSSPEANAENIPKKSMYSISEPKDGDTALLCGFLHPKTIQGEILFALLPEFMIIKKDDTSSQKISQLVAILQLECSVSQSGCELALARLTDLLLVYIVEQIVDEHLVDIKLLDISQHAPFSDLLLQIMHNPTLDWSIDMMAGKVNMSRSTFIRKIDDICGYTPNELVTRLRINIAINLLRRGYKVEEVTSRVGYESLSGFNKAFRKITSSKPADFWKAR